MFSSALVTKFVCLQDYPKTTYSITQLIFTKFGGKVVHGPRKNSGFGGGMRSTECDSR